MGEDHPPARQVGQGRCAHDGTEPFGYRAQGLVDEHGATVIDPPAGKKTIEQGAATPVFGAASPLRAGTGGMYLNNSDIAVLDDEDRPMTADSIPADANTAMLDPDDARRLWTLSEPLLA